MTCYGNFDAGCLMPPIETETPAQALAAARRAIDGAMTRDRGQLHGLWSRWQARPADAALRQRFEQSLAQSCARRAARAGAVPAMTFDQGAALIRDLDDPEVTPDAGQKVCDAVVAYATAKAAATGAPVRRWPAGSSVHPRH